MDINCSQVVEKYLLNKNPLYAFSFPLSILIAIIVFGMAKAYKWSDNSYINQILIPIVAFLLVMVVIDIISRQMISKKELAMLTEKCKLWTSDPSVKNNPILNKNIDIDLVLDYNNERFTTYNEQPSSVNSENNMDNMDMVDINQLAIPNISKENKVNNLIDEIPNIFPQPLEYNKFDNAMCIQPSNCCSLCSGSPNSNPCNLVAPIPGPQWIPQSAESVQNRLVNNDYTLAKCVIK